MKVMFQLIWVISYCISACLAASIGFAGQFVNVPTEALESPQYKHNDILNGRNFQSRFDISLTSLAQEEAFTTRNSVVNKNYKFTFDDLTSGEYELIVNSYDLILENQRFRVIVDESDATVKVYDDDLISKTYNASSARTVSYLLPLKIEVDDLKQYYEQQSGSLFDILLNSPFGFIFKNRTYTTIFIIAVAVMVTPYLLQFINPDFAEEFNQIKQEVDQAKQSQPEKPPTKASPPLRGNSGGLRQRK